MEQDPALAAFIASLSPRLGPWRNEYDVDLFLHVGRDTANTGAIRLKPKDTSRNNTRAVILALKQHGVGKRTFALVRFDSYDHKLDLEVSGGKSILIRAPTPDYKSQLTVDAIKIIEHKMPKGTTVCMITVAFRGRTVEGEVRDMSAPNEQRAAMPVHITGSTTGFVLGEDDDGVGGGGAAGGGSDSGEAPVARARRERLARRAQGSFGKIKRVIRYSEELGPEIFFDGIRVDPPPGKEAKYKALDQLLERALDSSKGYFINREYESRVNDALVFTTLGWLPKDELVELPVPISRDGVEYEYKYLEYDPNEEAPVWVAVTNLNTEY